MIADLDAWRAGQKREDSAANAIRPKQPSLHNMTDAMLADEHRGQSFAKTRAAERLAAIEAELERRGLDKARGALSLATRHDGPGLIDLKRLRAEVPEAVWRPFVAAGSGFFWRSRTLSAAERAEASK